MELLERKMNNGLLISYNMVHNEKSPGLIDAAGMVRLNMAWFTLESLRAAAFEIKKPKFVDLYTDRKKPTVSKHDYEELLRLVGQLGIDWVGLSKVEEPAVVLEARKIISNPKTRVCSKIESGAGCSKLDEICRVSDGIMVDAEDLANEIGWEATRKESEKIYSVLRERKYPYFKLSGVIFEYDHLPSKATVYTYGVFDLLHPGHIKLLETAAACGDKLIVGVVSDKAVSEKKGKDRPVQNLANRIRILGSLKCVDEAIEQKEFDPTPNLEIYKPDILVKGDDWDYIPGQDWILAHGKTLIKPKYSEGYSTSSTVEKMRKNM